MSDPDYRSTIMRVAGNLLGGVLATEDERDQMEDEARRESAVDMAVLMASEIVAETLRQLRQREMGHQSPPKEES